MFAGAGKTDERQSIGGTMKSLLEAFHCGLYGRFRDRPELSGVKIFRYGRDEFPQAVDCLIAGQSSLAVLILPPILDSLLPNSPSHSDAIVEQRIRVVENLLLNGSNRSALETAEFIHRWMGGACMEIASGFYTFSPRMKNPWKIRDAPLETGRMEIELSFETRMRFHSM